MSWHGCYIYIYLHTPTPAPCNLFSVISQARMYHCFPCLSFLAFHFSIPLHPLSLWPRSPAACKQKCIQRSLKLNFGHLCFSDHLLPPRTATSQRQGILVSVTQPVPRKGGCLVRKAQVGKADGYRQSHPEIVGIRSLTRILMQGF